MRNNRLGLLVDYCSSEYVIALSKSLHSYCSERGIQLYVFPVRSIGAPQWKFDYQYLAGAAHINSKNLDGLIIASGTLINTVSPEDFISYVHSLYPLPVVSIGFEIPGVHSIVSDCVSGFSALLNHLIEEHNCRKIALMGVTGNSWEAHVREDIYKKTLAAHKIEVDESLIMRGWFEYTSAYRALEQYVQEYGYNSFDAIVSINDDMAYACIDFLREHNQIVPDNIIVTGFDDLTRAAYSTPTLSTVNQDLEKQGFLAAELMYDIIDGKDVPLCTKVEAFPVYRQSCGCIPMEERNINFIDRDGKKHKFDFVHQTQSVAEWFIKRQQVTRVTQFISECQDEVCVKDLHRELGNMLMEYSINAAVVCLFETPIETDRFVYFKLPDDAYVLCGFDKSLGLFSLTDDDAEMTHFNPNETLVPPEYKQIKAESKIVIPLFHCKIQYGYMVYELGDFDITVYEILCKSLSNLISTAVINTKAEIERASLAQKNEFLDYISRTDELTHVLNRRGFMLLGQQTIEIACSMNEGGIVVFGDMDGLKKINDTYGHEAGDTAIEAEARLLKSAFRTSDIVGRLGGDEFAAVAVGLTMDDFEQIKQKLDADCAEWNKNSGEPFCISISLGAVLFDSTLIDLTNALRLADEAQYKEKSRKKAKALS